MPAAIFESFELSQLNRRAHIHIYGMPTMKWKARNCKPQEVVRWLSTTGTCCWDQYLEKIPNSNSGRHKTIVTSGKLRSASKY